MRNMHDSHTPLQWSSFATVRAVAAAGLFHVRLVRYLQSESWSPPVASRNRTGIMVCAACVSSQTLCLRVQACRSSSGSTIALAGAF